MASVRIENDAWDDPRYVLLGQRLGIDRFDALIRCARVWSYCTDRGAHVLPAEMIDAHVGVAGFAEHMVGVQLAEKVAQGIRVCGTRGRIEWLDKRKKASRKGGVTTRAKWRPNEGQTRAKRGPSAPTLLCSGSAPTLLASEKNPEAAEAAPPAPAQLVMPALPGPTPDVAQMHPHKQVVDAWERLYVARTGSKYGWRDKRHHGQIQALLKHAKGQAGEVIARATRLFEAPPSFIARDGTPPEIGDLLTHWNRLVEPNTRAGPLFAGTRGHAPPSDASEFGDGDVNKRGGT